MRDDCQRGDDTQSSICKEGRGDDDPVAEIVDAVAHDDAPSAAPRLLLVEAVMMVMFVAFMMVTVAIQLRLFKQKEEQQSAQQRGKKQLWTRLALEGLGQHIEQRGSQQDPG